MFIRIVLECCQDAALNSSDIGSAGRAPLYLEEGNQRVHHVSTHGGHVKTGEVGNDNLKLVATKC